MARKIPFCRSCRAEEGAIVETPLVKELSEVYIGCANCGVRTQTRILNEAGLKSVHYLWKSGQVIYPKEPTLGQYWELLNRHDWYYGYSDDRKTNQAGRAYAKYLFDISPRTKEHQELHTQFMQHHTSRKSPLPEKPE